MKNVSHKRVRPDQESFLGIMTSVTNEIERFLSINFRENEFYCRTHKQEVQDFLNLHPWLSNPVPVFIVSCLRQLLYPTNDCQHIFLHGDPRDCRVVLSLFHRVYGQAFFNARGFIVVPVIYLKPQSICPENVLREILWRYFVPSFNSASCKELEAEAKKRTRYFTNRMWILDELGRLLVGSGYGDSHAYILNLAKELRISLVGVVSPENEAHIDFDNEHLSQFTHIHVPSRFSEMELKSCLTVD